MTQLTDVDTSFRFPGWELRPRERVLLVRGEAVKIGSRAFDLLRVLAEQRGAVVSKDRLISAVWQGLVVEENNLSVQIAALRKVIGSDAIVNVSGIGYRLAAVPEPKDASADHSAPAQPFGAPELIGRSADMQLLAEMVGQVPIVSIVGTGGVGKTSIAKALLADAAFKWRDGVHWIDLAPLPRGAPLMQLVAQSLGVLPEDRDRASDDLALALSQMHALVALDNCEHLLDEVAAIVRPLLTRAPGVRWLVTSQQPLRVPGESVYRLGPLDVPPQGVEFERAVGYGAVALFRKRAEEADRRFELTPQGLELVGELCRQLDGLPLAIEMAAARVASLGLRGVHDQIAQRLKLTAGSRGTPERHHTLLQTFEWSCGLLTAVEQAVFRRLQPFLGGFSAKMAQDLCGAVGSGDQTLDTWQIVDALSSLVDKSLVQCGETTASTQPPRFHLLESARDYAGVLLGVANELDQASRAHATVVAAWFETAHEDLNRWRDGEWAARYLPERANVDAALAWACSARRPDLLARLVAAMSLLDNFSRTPAEVVRHKIPLEVLAEATPQWRALAYLEFGWAHYFDANRRRGTELVRLALADFEVLGNVAGVYSALHRLARLCLGRPGMQSEARDLWLRLRQIDENLVPLRVRLEHHCTRTIGPDDNTRVDRLRQLHHVAQVAGFDAQAAVCRANLVDALLVERRFEEAVETASAMLEGNEPWLRIRAMICHNKALALVRLGRIEEARTSAATMLRGLPGEAHMAMDILALAAALGGRAEDSAIIVGCSARVKRERDRCAEPAEEAVIVDTLERLAKDLGPERRDELIRLGGEMPVADMLVLAMKVQ